MKQQKPNLFSKAELDAMKVPTPAMVERERQRQQRIADLQERVRREAPLKQGDGYVYQGIEQVTTKRSIVMVHCPNPDHEWHPMRVDLILQGCKCRECAGRHQSLEQRREKFRQRFLKRIDHDRFIVAFDEYVNNDTPISVRCIEHNYDYKTTPDNLLRKTGGCPYCTASGGEATVLSWLNSHHVNHVWHYPLPNTDSSLPLLYIEADFFLPDRNIIIEYHGEQHYMNVPHFYKGKKLRNFNMQQHRDRYLRRYCHDNGIRLIEIPYWNFKRIDEILTEELLNIND